MSVQEVYKSDGIVVRCTQMNWMRRWQIEGDPRRWIGRTVAEVEVLNMEYGSVPRQCTLVRFTDGSRGWVAGGVSSNIAVGPDVKDMKKSNIITPEEIAEIEAEAHRKRQEKARDEQRIKQEQLARLKRELGEED